MLSRSRCTARESGEQRWFPIRFFYLEMLLSSLQKSSCLRPVFAQNLNLEGSSNLSHTSTWVKRREGLR